MRIVIAFLGKPEEVKKILVKIVKCLEKEKINVDKINLKKQKVSKEKFKVFLDIMIYFGETGSHLMMVSLGQCLINTTVGSHTWASNYQIFTVAGTRDFPFRVDLTELALSLRIFMEEKRQWQKTLAQQTAESSTKARAVACAVEDSEDALLERIIYQQESGHTLLAGPNSAAKKEQMAHDSKVPLKGAKFGQAKPMSMTAPGTFQPAKEKDDYDLIQHAKFLQKILQDLPGVDPKSDTIQNTKDCLASEEKNEI